MTAKIVAALTSSKSVRQELAAASRGFTKAAKNVALLEAKLIAAQKELDTAVTRAEVALKKAEGSVKALDVSKVKKVPAVKPAAKPAAKTTAKPLPKPAAKTTGKPVAKKPTRAEQRAANKVAAAKVGSHNDGKLSASRPLKTAAKPAVKKPAVKAPIAK